MFNQITHVWGLVDFLCGSNKLRGNVPSSYRLHRHTLCGHFVVGCLLTAEDNQTSLTYSLPINVWSYLAILFSLIVMEDRAEFFTRMWSKNVFLNIPFKDIPVVRVVSVVKIPFSTVSSLFNSNWHFHFLFPSTPPPRPWSPDSFQTGLPQREIPKFWTQTTNEKDGGKCSAVKSLNVVMGIRWASDITRAQSLLWQKSVLNFWVA